VAAFLHAVVVVVVAEAVPWAGAIDIYSSGIYRVFVRDGYGNRSVRAMERLAV